MLCSAFKVLLVSLDKVGLEEGTTDRTDVADWNTEASDIHERGTHTKPSEPARQLNASR